MFSSIAIFCAINVEAHASRCWMANTILIYFYKALRCSGHPLDTKQKKKNHSKRRVLHDWLCVGANRPHVSSRSPAATQQVNNHFATCTIIPRMYLVLIPTCDFLYVCLEACQYRAFVSTMTYRDGLCVCAECQCGKKLFHNAQQTAEWN